MDKKFFKDCAVDLLKQVCGLNNGTQGFGGVLRFGFATLEGALGVVAGAGYGFLESSGSGLYVRVSNMAVRSLEGAAISAGAFWTATALLDFVTDDMPLRWKESRKRNVIEPKMV